MTEILAPVSIGEVIDKITILQIKSERIDDETKLANVRAELQALQNSVQATNVDRQSIASHEQQLKFVNEQLWDIEDAIRDLESKAQFDREFVELARSVYLTNDRRCAIKREINLSLGSALVEEKSYKDYQRG